MNGVIRMAQNRNDKQKGNYYMTLPQINKV